MIKRNYFISTCAVKDGENIMSWRVFHCTSFFANHTEAVEFIVDKIANDNNIDPKDVSIKAFNRV